DHQPKDSKCAWPGRAAAPVERRRRGDRMRRREFVTLLTTVVVRPLVARAQQGERPRRIGVLIGSEKATPEEGSRAEHWCHRYRSLDGSKVKIYRSKCGGAEAT